MTFLDKLKAHIGGLIHIKTKLFWYKEGGWAEASERVYLLLDVLNDSASVTTDATVWVDLADLRRREPAIALLFIDGAPKWIRVNNLTVELIK